MLFQKLSYCKLGLMCLSQTKN